MKTYIVPARMLKAARHCQGKDDIRYYLNGIHVSKTRIAATNGHILFSGDFTESGFDQLDIDDRGLIVDLPRVPPKSAYFARLTVIDSKRGIVEYFSGRFDRESVAVGAATPTQSDVFSIIDGDFPNLERVMPDESKRESVGRIGVNDRYLSMVGRVFGDLLKTFEGVELNFYGEHAALAAKAKSVEYPNCTLIVMPIRL